jgi:hypothetical protein
MAVVLEASEPRVEREQAVEPAAVKPPRLNFARVCLRCDERDCTSPECIAWYAESCWAICPDCDGLCWMPDVRPCGCLFGVVEMYPASASERLAAV